MGQKQSTSKSGSFSKSGSQSTTTTTCSVKKLEPKLTPIEITSLKQIYHQLKSIGHDKADLITAETFQEYLGLPENMLFGKMLYRSFVQLPYIANDEMIPEDPKLNYALLLYSVRFYCGKDQTLEVSPLEDSARDLNLQSKLLFDSFCNSPVGRSEGKVICRELLELFKGILWIFKAHCLTLISTEIELTELIIDEKILISLVQQMAAIERKSLGIPGGSFSAKLLEEEISWTTFQNFIKQNSPNVFRILETFVYKRFCMSAFLSSSSKVESTSPKWLLVGTESILPNIDLKSNILKIDDWGLLTWLLPSSKGGSWDVLYSGSEHGFNFSYIEAKVFNYPAPTCLLIKGSPLVSRQFFKNRFLRVTHDPRFSSQELILGAYISEPWKFSRSFWGNVECKLFELGPIYEVFPATGNRENYVYCHRSNGIGFGGRVNNFRLHIKPDLKTGIYSNDPLHGMWSYKLSSTRTDFDVTFQIDDIEVIGLGGEAAKVQQASEWLLEEQKGRATSHSSEQTRQLLEQAGILECSKKLDEFRTRKNLRKKRKSFRYTPYN